MSKFEKMPKNKGVSFKAKECKLCKLIKTNPDIYSKLYERVMEGDFSERSSIMWLNNEADIYNSLLPEDADEELKIPQYNQRNFYNHFTKHVTKTAIIAKDIKKTMSNAGVDFSDVPSKLNVHDIVADDFFYDMTEELTDYTDITKMVNTTESLLQRYHDETLAPEVKPGQTAKKLNLNSIKEFKNMLSDLADMKLKLAKLRNSSYVAGSAVKRAVAMSVEMFMNSLLAITQEAAESFKEANPGSTVGDAIIETMRNKMKEQVKFAVKEIIDETFEEFKIK